MAFISIDGPDRAACGRRGVLSSRRAVALAAALGLAALVAATSSSAAAQLVRGDNPLGSYLAGRVAVQTHDLGAGAAFLRDALRADPRDPLLLDATLRTVLADGQIEAGMRLAQRVVKVDPDNPLARVALAVRAIKLHRYRTARTEIRRGFRRKVPDMVGSLITAWALAGSGDTTAALTALDQLNGDTLSNLFGDFHGGLIAAMGGRDAVAKDRFSAALAGDPTNFVLVDAYARFLAHSGDTDGALKLYRGLAEKPHNNAQLDADIATVEHGGKLDPLVRDATQGIAEALFGFGQLASHSRTADFAMVYFNLALYLQPGHELALLTLADLYESVQDYQRAIETYQRLPADSTFRTDADVRIAGDLAASGKSADAQAKLVALIAVHPDNIPAITTLGNLQHKDKQYAAAAATYSKAIDQIKQSKQGDWSIYFARAVAYHLGGDWPKAEADLEMAHKLAPDQPAVLNYLGYSWIDRGEHLEAGLKMIRRAVALRPNDGDIIDSLAWAHFRVGDLRAALAEELHAVELKPGSWEINDHLGDMQWRAGNHLLARFNWLHALIFEPAADKRSGIERKVNDGLPALKASDPEAAGQKAVGDHEGVGADAAARPARQEPPPAVKAAPAPGGEAPTAPPTVAPGTAPPKAGLDHMPAPTTAPKAEIAPTPATPSATKPATASRPSKVTVQPGDTLWSIAADTMGDSRQFWRLMRANRIRRNQILVPGEVIVIPAPAGQ